MKETKREVKLTFGGKEVTINKGKTKQTTYINCMGTEVGYHHIELIVQVFNVLEAWNVPSYTSEVVYKIKEINDTPIEDTLITIGCLTGTLKELKEIIKEANK